MVVETYETTHAGKTALQIKQETPGTPEHAQLQKTRLRSDMEPLKKKLIALKMDLVQNAFNKGEEAVLKSVDAIGSMEALKSALISAGYSPKGFK